MNAFIYFDILGSLYQHYQNIPFILILIENNAFSVEFFEKKFYYFSKPQ